MINESREIEAYIGLGSNLGDRAQALRWAAAQIADLPGLRLLSRSRFYESAAQETDIAQPPFLNAVLRVATTLSPFELLAQLQQIEHEGGRRRLPGIRNAPRVLDLDLLLYGDLHLETEALVLPHPRILNRAFVVLPLCELGLEQLNGVRLASLRFDEASMARPVSTLW
ncbi:MAG: 2-amino-4-hydroxy-6-hydroxymethyldihydropteridine diphosphokinase [Casimicrobiaceae bacterium]|nr:2-amino-4-hydroxy-6-hydroxymethyldihydropteridine diphosphokinase [Casimicrobiaceae bacterium]